MNKELIKKRFAKNLDTYNANAKVQKRMAEYLMRFVDNRHFETVLEIGCGTGMLTELAFKNLEFSKYIANDIVYNCKNYIQKISPQIEFVHSDIEDFLKADSTKYDLILSNAVFQWIEDFKEFVKLLMTKLNNDGILLFSTFGVRNFQEINQILGKTLVYHHTDMYKKLLKDYSYIIEEEIYTLGFKTPVDVIKHIKLTGANAVDEIRWTKSDMSRFELKYNELCKNKPVLTYNPVYIKIFKN